MKRIVLAAAVAAVATLCICTNNTTEPNDTIDDEGDPVKKETVVDTTPPYTIRFFANRGTVSPISDKTDSTGRLASLPTPTRCGYTFDGWFTTATGGTEITDTTIFSANDTIYAQWVAAPTSETDFIDCRDGKIYKKVTIGTQTWMAENLNYSDTSSISRSSACYDNNADSCEKYGRLYTEYATYPAVVCPAGWHLPTDKEWDTLMVAVGGSSTAGTKLKAQTGWYDFLGVPAGNGADDYGFSALPGGRAVRSYAQIGINSTDSFSGIGSIGYWWCARKSVNDDSWFWDMRSDAGRVRMTRDSNINYRGSLFSVRCVED